MSDVRELALENQVMRLEEKLAKYESSASPVVMVEHRVIRRVVCAACKVGDLILCGPRHWDSTMRKQAKAIQGHEGWASQWSKAEQGFVDQWGVFMDRKEAMQVAKTAGQSLDIDRGCGGDETTLYSEGLY